MGKLKNCKAIYQGEILIKNIFKYLLEHLSGVKKKEDYKKLRANYGCIFYSKYNL